MQIVLFVLVVAAVGLVLIQVLGEARSRDRIDAASSMAIDRADERARDSLTRPGATPENPAEFESAAAVEPAAERVTCPVCANPRHVLEHAVTGEGSRRLRALVLRCGTCGRRSSYYARVRAPHMLN